MNKEEKNQLIESLTAQLRAAEYFYLTDISDLNSDVTSKLRRLCFRRDVKLVMVKNTLLRKAMEASEKDFNDLFPALKGSTSVMFAQAGNAPAKLIQEFRKKENQAKPIVKGAYVEETCYVGDNTFELMLNIKSKNELIADIIFLLQSPARNVISGLQSGGGKLMGILKTLSEK